MKKKVAYQDIIFTFQGIESVFHKSSLLFNNQSSGITDGISLKSKGNKKHLQRECCRQPFFSSKINNELTDLYVDGSKLLCFALH